MKSTNWFFVFLLAAIIGIGTGYVLTLWLKPTLLPPALRLGSLYEPTTVLFLGTDVVYSKQGRQSKADSSAFNGRSDTIVVARLDPLRNTLSALSIPRDTQVYIAHYGSQKINAANALGGPDLARDVVSEFLGVPIDHYVVLNLQGLIKLVDTLGGITVEIPKRMHYMDWTAKLKIDLEPGFHTLTGNQAQGFVRFRHDALGDIGRIQRQEIFMRAVLDRALKPESWGHIPELIEIARQYVATDLNDAQVLSMATFIRGVPKQNQQLVLLPGNFAADSSGNWITNRHEVSLIVAKLFGEQGQANTRRDIRVTIENRSGHADWGRRLGKLLQERGYNVVAIKSFRESSENSHTRTRIIAQRGNPEDAEMIKSDLESIGEVVNVSIGDIESTVTVIAGDDLESLLSKSTVQQSAR